MKIKWIESVFCYDGSQLHSQYAYLNHGVCGDSLIAWKGPCRVDLEHMVDGEDKLLNSQICGDEMVHFIMEVFNASLLAGVALQRLFANVVREVLNELNSTNNQVKKLRREGDDLYFENLKLSISIATISPLSTLIHFAVNVSRLGTPVPTLSLKDLGVDPKVFALEVMKSWQREMVDVIFATQKVQWVK